MVSLFLYCSLLLGLAAAHPLYAQLRIKGQVTDASNNTPLIGANVLIKGTGTGTVADLEGNYTLANVPEGATLVFSYIGYLSQEVPVNGRAQISTALKPDAELLSEVVVVGYGVQEKKDVTGAVAMVDDEALKGRVNTNVGALLQGQSAGVQVVSGSGKPSAGISLRIRGTNSINAGSEPLYVVDGVPMSDTRALNPADIESISILKDASSAAIYGAQGANGVVLITTKRGKSDKPRFQFDTYTGFAEAWKTQKVLNAEQYRDLMEELGQRTDWSKYNHNTDWQDEVLQRGVSQNYQLSVSGKSEKTSYYISGGYVQQRGTVRSSEMDRWNFKVNLDQELRSWLKMGTSMAYTNYSDVDVADNQAINQGGVILGMLSTPPNIGIYNADGTFTSNPFQNWENPISSTDASDRGYRNNRLIGNIYAEVTPLEGLKFRSNIGIEHANGTYEYFLDPFRTSYGRAMKGISRYNTDASRFFIVDNTVSYDKKMGRHKLSALAGSVLQKYSWDNSAIERRGFAGDQISTPNAGAEIITATAYKSEKANAAFIGRLNYDFAERYLLTANFRADASSNFGPDSRWGFFPSFSAGWRVSEEAFMQDVDFIDDMKLRAGWGVVGNDNIGNYAYFGKVGSGGNYPIGGSILPGTYPGSIENRNLKWEESAQTNVGLDLAVLEGRVTLIADAYYKRTYDLLLNAPLPSATGFQSAIQNVGELENKGLEFQLKTVNVDKAVRWESDFNISFNRNKVVSIKGEELYAGGVAGRGDVALVREGLPLGTFYGYVAGGVDPATGMVYYLDKNGESTFAPQASDRRVIGNANPDFTYALSNRVSYKGWSLFVMLQGSQGNDIFNATRIETEGMQDAKNQSYAVLDRWRNPGDQALLPKAVWGSTDNSRLSTRFVEDGSYLRVKALTLSYDFPATLLKRLDVNSLRLYVTGENLLTFTKYSGYDPEVNAFGGSNTALGVDFGTYPQSRSFLFGLNVSF